VNLTVLVTYTQVFFAWNTAVFYSVFSAEKLIQEQESLANAREARDSLGIQYATH